MTAAYNGRGSCTERGAPSRALYTLDAARVAGAAGVDKVGPRPSATRIGRCARALTHGVGTAGGGWAKRAETAGADRADARPAASGQALARRRRVAQPFFAAALRFACDWPPVSLRAVLLRLVLFLLELLRLLRLEVLLLFLLEPPLLFLPPFRAEALESVLPLPEPDSLPPPESLLTVAQARRLASFLLTPRFL
jgi:hypothetical protein